MQDGVDGVVSDAFRRDSNAGPRVSQAFAGLGVNVVIKLLSRRHRRWGIYRQCNSASYVITNLILQRAVMESFTLIEHLKKLPSCDAKDRDKQFSLMKLSGKGIW